MLFAKKSLVIAAVTVLDAGCLLGVACLGGALVPPAPAPEAAGTFERPAIERGARAALRAAPTRVEPDDAETVRRAPPDLTGSSGALQTESDHYQAFLDLAREGRGSLETAARSALAGDGPTCGQVAALRALRDVGSPATDELLLAAILRLPETSGDGAASVPRVALRMLEDRATTVAEARRSLEISAFGPYPVSPPSRGLRAAAVAALARGADEEGRARLRGFLQSETDEVVLASGRASLDPALESGSEEE